MTTTAPTFSIIIPSLNQPPLMDVSIGAVLGQSYSRVQLIIADCGMNEETHLAVSKYAAQVTVVAVPTPATWQDAVNVAVESATGEVISWLVPGDTYRDGAFAEIVRCLDAQPAAAAIMGGAVMSGLEDQPHERRHPGDGSIDWFGKWPESWLPGAAVFVKCQAWQQCGPLASVWSEAAELDLWLKIAAKFQIAATDFMVCQMKEAPFADQGRFLVNVALVLQHHGLVAEARRWLLEFAGQSRQTIKGLQTELRGLEQRLEALNNSISWRISAPLRAIAQSVKPAGCCRQRLVESQPETVSVVNEPWPTDKPLVSVVIPCFNYGEYIEAAVDSVLAQTFQNFEIIVVEGGSSQRATVMTLQELHKPRTTVYFRPSAKLVGDNRNFGIERAVGKYICCLDADDLLAPTYLEKAVFVAETYGADIVYPAVKSFCGNSDEWGGQEVRFPEIAAQNQLPIVSLFRRADWEKVGGFRDWGAGSAYIFEDWDFWVRMLGHGCRAIRIPEPLMLYRVHGQGVTAANRIPVSKQAAVIREANRELFTRQNIDAVAKLQAISSAVSNPWVNLYHDRTGQTLLLFLSEWAAVRDERQFDAFLQRAADRGFKVSIVTTDEVAGGDGCASSSGISGAITYHLSCFLKNRQQWLDFVGYLHETREFDAVILLETPGHPLLPEIKALYSDQQPIMLTDAEGWGKITLHDQQRPPNKDLTADRAG